MGAQKHVSKVEVESVYTAEAFIERMLMMQARASGLKTNDIFRLAREFMKMPISEIELLIKSSEREIRLGAVSIMDFQARKKNTSEELRKKLYDLYIKNHDRIDDWGMVDRSAPYVVGGYLFDKSRAPLYKLAKSKNLWERRTSIVATYFFIRQNDIEDTFRIAEMIVYDKEHFVNTAVGSWIREAGKRDKTMLVNFIERHYKRMPRITLRYAVEKLDKKAKEKYLKAKD